MGGVGWEAEGREEVRRGRRKDSGLGWGRLRADLLLPFALGRERFTSRKQAKASYFRALDIWVWVHSADRRSVEHGSTTTWVLTVSREPRRRPLR